MKRISTFLSVTIITILALIPAMVLGQKTNQQVPVPENQFRSAADNIGYWMEAAERGLVPLNQPIPVKPAEFIGSKIGSKSIEQMSTDVCVWDETGVTQSENSITINPLNEAYVLNSNNSESGGSIYGANYLNSYNSGSSWSGSHNGAGGGNKGDPAAAIGPNGRRYIGFITSNRGQGIAWSDNGTTWNPVALTGGFTYPDLMDKNHLTVDPRSSGTYSGYVYSAWTHFETGDPNDTEIEFCRSTNSGVTWSSPYAISSAVAAGSHNQGVNIQTGPSGQVYAVWVVYDTWYPSSTYENAIGFARSLNGGASFYSASRIHNNIKGIRPSPYSPTTNPTGKNMRCNSFPSMAVDISGGSHNGYIYVVWANQGVPGTNTGTNVSVYCMRSTNGGVSWGTPVRVNQGTTANDYASFFPWITCDPVTGKLYCVFYDDRNLGSSSSACEVWCSVSEDGGVSWEDFRVGDVSFTPSPIPGLASGYFGDYLGIDAQNNKVYPCWTDNRSGRALTYVSPIEFSDYCVATGGCDEYISNVQFGSINNSSACEGFENYTDLSNDVYIGSPENITVTNGNPIYTSDQCGIWVDWNRDGDFNDANETISVSGTPGVGPYSATINPPAGTLQGPTTLRVRITYVGTLSPCGTTTYGEVEDYTINVLKNCAASGGCDEYISNVQIGSINNSSGCDGYHDYSNLSTNIDHESSAIVTVTNGNPIYSSDQCGIWVDWNQDDDFADANETISVTGTPGVGPYTATIAPPAGVISGPRTMRIRIMYSGTLSPCGTTSYGEVEDYTINVTGVNTWVGTYNNYWHQAANWSAGHIPLAGEDVIINNTGYQPVYVDDYPGFTFETCDNLDIGAGASVEIRNMELTVNGNLNVIGGITMVQDGGILDIYGDTYWSSGSTFDATVLTTFINAFGNWNFNSGADFSPTTGFVDFRGTSDCWIRAYSTTCNFYNMRVYKSGGAKAKVSNNCTQDLVINNLTFITTGAILENWSSQNIVMKGPFNYYGTFDFTLFSNTGSVVFDGVSQAINNYSSGSGVFNNVIFSSSTGTTVAGGDLNVANDLSINQGYFSPGTNPVYVGGDWTNTVGDAGFTETDSHVIINGGNYHQYCSDEIFNILEINKASGGAFRINGTDVVCAAYDWTAGAIDVLSGSFTANDLLDNAVTGAFYVNPGGTINLTNSGTGTYVDLNADLHNFGGVINISGSVSYWPYMHDASIEMTDGVIDLTDCGIYVSSTATYNLTDNITGGTIRTAYGFSGNRADFTPTLGTFEFYSTNDAYFSESNGCTIPNVIINKGAKKGMATKSGFTQISAEKARIDVTKGKGTKANSLILNSDVTITNNLDIQGGILDLASYTCNVAGTTNIEGTLAITQPAADLTSGSIYWNSGSNDNVTAGTFHAGIWQFVEGTNAMLGTGNTAYLQDMYFPTDADAEFGNLVVVPFTKNSISSPEVTYPTHVAGNFTIQNGASWSFPYDLMVAGNATIESGATLTFSGGAEFNVTGDLDLSGTLNLNATSSSVLHGDLNFPAAALLNIGDGSNFSSDYNMTSGFTSLNGEIDMTGAAVFEMSMRSVNIGAAFIDDNILGGTMRFGRTLNATSSNNFQLTNGTVEFISNTGGHYVNVINGNYLNNVVVDKVSASYQVYDDLILKGDMTINSGVLNSYSHLINVGGDWTNNVGPAAFAEGTGEVIFDGTGALNHQFINGTETFYNLTNAKTGGGHLNIAGNETVSNTFLANGINLVSGSALTVNGLLNLSTGELSLTSAAPTVTVNNFTMGGVFSVTDGTFTCTDMTNNGIFGTINIYGGVTNLHQDVSQFIDLNADLTISNGQLNIFGTGGGSSVWTYSANASITMSGGILDFKELGVYVGTNNTLTENITGGTIRTVADFAVARTDFTPTGGTVELYGGSDAPIYTNSGSNLFNVLINKSGGTDEIGANPNEFEFNQNQDNSETGNEVTSSGNPERPKFPVNPTEANSVYLAGNLLINGTTNINEGTFLIATGFAVTDLNNINVNSGGILNVDATGILKIANSRTLSVNSGGMLSLTGNSTNAATVTHNSGYYALNIESGGTIGADYGIFEYMNSNGVFIKPGALVASGNAFNNCTFQNGQSGGRLMTVHNSQTFNVNDAVFPTNTWGSSYNVYKNVNSGTANFVNATGDFAGESYDYDPYNRVNWTIPALTFNLKVFLEGPFDAGTNMMKTDLNSSLPVSQPYDPSLPYFGNPSPDWYYGGSETVGSIPNTNIVDWIVVQLRDATSPASATPATAIATQAAFVNNIGEIVGMDGSSPINFTTSYSNDLYVVIWHRNHLGVISANALVNSGGTFAYDFSSGSGQAYGGTSAQKQLATGIWGMMVGDADGSGQVMATDKTNVWDVQAGLAGYKASDLNMNGQVNNIDKDDYWLPNLGEGTFIP